MFLGAYIAVTEVIKDTGCTKFNEISDYDIEM